MARPDIRLLAIDVDGTLVDDRKEIPAANIRALRAAVDRGVHVAIASGRMISSIEIMERRLGLDCALIAYNGGKVLTPLGEGRRVLEHNPLPLDVSEPLREFARSERYLLNFYIDDRLYADSAQERNPLVEVYSRRTGSVYNFVDAEWIAGRETTKLILLAEAEEVSRLHGHFSGMLDGRANVLITDPEYLEIMRADVDKSTALPALARHYGIGLDQVMAIGDGHNDRRMIEIAGVGVAVKNSRQEVLDIADHVTSRTNNEGAVAEAVERWVLGEGSDVRGGE